MSIELIISFIGASVILTLMPGPDNLYVLSESISNGRKTGISISMGLVSGVLVHTLLAATGLSIFLQQSDRAYDIIKMLGSAYLFYLAFMAYKEEIDQDQLKSRNETKSYNFFSLYKRGFIMNVLNPKVSLFFIAFLPQFISDSGVHPMVQMSILGLIFMVQAILIFILISILAGIMQEQLKNKTFQRVSKIMKILVLLALGAFLLLSEK